MEFFSFDQILETYAGYDHDLSNLVNLIDYTGQQIPDIVGNVKVSPTLDLYDHQKKSIFAARNLETSVPSNGDFFTKLGILGDKVGAGKTFICLGLVKLFDTVGIDFGTSAEAVPHIPSTPGTNLRRIVTRSCNLPMSNDYFQHFPSIEKSSLVYRFVDNPRRIKTSIILIPHNLFSQWSSAITRYDPNFSVHRINTRKQLREGTVDYGAFDIILITNTMFKEFCEVVKPRQYIFQKLFIDEANSIQLSGYFEFPKTEFVWLITASINELMNGIVKSAGIRAMIKFMYSRYILPRIVVKNREECVDNSITLPTMIVRDFVVKDPVNITVLRSAIGQSIINHLNAGDVKGALGFLGPEQVTSRSSLVKQFVQHFETQVLEISRKLEVPEITPEEKNRLLQKSMGLQDKINGIRERMVGNNLCIICYDSEISQEAIVPCCQRGFCLACISAWLDQTPLCPYCKTATTISQLNVVMGDSSDSNSSGPGGPGGPDTPKTKLQILYDILTDYCIGYEGSGIIVFNDFHGSFNEIQPVCTMANKTIKELKGSDAVIKSTISKIKTGELDIFFMNSDKIGSGLNLEFIDTIVIFHKMSSEKEKQLIGRCQRLGRTKPLHIFRLYHESEL